MISIKQKARIDQIGQKAMITNVKNAFKQIAPKL